MGPLKFVETIEAFGQSIFNRNKAVTVFLLGQGENFLLDFVKNFAGRPRLAKSQFVGLGGGVNQLALEPIIFDQPAVMLDVAGGGDRVDQSGQGFGAAEATEAARAAVKALEPALKAHKAPRRGRLLLATVKGDVHDIGKNLVNIIFESNGFEVEDLGVKIPPEEIAAAAVKFKPDFIGLSGLLVRSCEQMTVTARELAKAGVKAPLLVGGAALTQKFTVCNIAPHYSGPVFYSRDAMEGLNYALNFSAAGHTPESLELPCAAPAAALPKAPSGALQARPADPRPSDFTPEDIPVPPDLDRHFTGEQPLGELFDNLDENLFGLRFLKVNKTQPKKAGEALKLLAALKKEIISGGIIKARGVYRFYKVNGAGDDLLVYGENDRQAAAFSFPRRKEGAKLCLADFAAPESGGKKDYAAFFAVTCGEGMVDFAERERKAGNYVRSYLVEALALTLAEAFADVIHYRIRKEWGIAEAKPARPLLRGKYRGKRYSFGYPACPDLAGQKTLFSLLRPEDDAGLRLTDGFMMDPEASVSAIVFHNPKAVNFSAV